MLSPLSLPHAKSNLKDLLKDLLWATSGPSVQTTGTVLAKF